MFCILSIARGGAITGISYGCAIYIVCDIVIVVLTMCDFDIIKYFAKNILNTYRVHALRDV